MTITRIYLVYAAVPYIVVETVIPTGTQQFEVDFNEYGNYISLLKQQQEAIGKFVNFDKGTYTENNKQYDAVIISASDSPPITPQVTINIVNDQNVTDFLCACSTAPFVNSNWSDSPSTQAITGTGYDIFAWQFKKTSSYDPLTIDFLLDGNTIDSFTPDPDSLSIQYHNVAGIYDTVVIAYSQQLPTLVINNLPIDCLGYNFDSRYNRAGAVEFNAASNDTVGYNMLGQIVSIVKTDATTEWQISTYRPNGTLINTVEPGAAVVKQDINIGMGANYVRTIVIEPVGAPTPPENSGTFIVESTSPLASIDSIADIINSGIGYPIQGATDGGVWVGFAGGDINVTVQTFVACTLQFLLNGVVTVTTPVAAAPGVYTLLNCPIPDDGDTIRIKIFPNS